jgi:enoyl-CoA hydratase
MADNKEGYSAAGSGVQRFGEDGFEVILVDEPVEGIRRITLNRPDKRNALNHALRGEVLHALQQGDMDERVKVQIIRGAGSCFSAGYDLGGGNEGMGYPFYTAGGDGQWPRHVTEGWMGIWDMAKPVIAQVHGYCLAGGSELATGCDLVYMADDAQMGYPAVRLGVPDMQFHPWLVGMRKGMEMLLTGDSLSGRECVERGWATDSFPLEELEDQVLDIAQRIAQLPTDIVQLNKRAVHRQMEAMGLRQGIRAGTELCTLGTHQPSFKEFLGKIEQKGLTGALQQRDEKFGDYRTARNQTDEEK